MSKAPLELFEAYRMKNGGSDVATFREYMAMVVVMLQGLHDDIQSLKSDFKRNKDGSLVGVYKGGTK